MHARWQVLAGFSAGVISKPSRGSRSSGPSATAKRLFKLVSCLNTDCFIEKKMKRNGQGLTQQFYDVTQGPGSFPVSFPPSLAHRLPFLYASPHRCKTAGNSPGAAPTKARAKTFLLLQRPSPFLEFIIVLTLGQPVMKTKQYYHRHHHDQQQQLG